MLDSNELSVDAHAGHDHCRGLQRRCCELAIAGQFYGKTSPQRFSGKVTLLPYAGRGRNKHGATARARKVVAGGTALGNFVRASARRTPTTALTAPCRTRALSARFNCLANGRMQIRANFSQDGDPSSLLRLRERAAVLARLVAYVACARRDAVSPSTREKRREAVRRARGGGALLVARRGDAAPGRDACRL